ncbi:helix-turn-helix domain-containing protein [Aliiglaciecola sp. NS0011-25]|uniref:helix-turn-helix domain-containing protein n=1 Tax=Aliiglaciecola sp. NS0011-25 TaxID=3127654 RepID=UPI003102B024
MKKHITPDQKTDALLNDNDTSANTQRSQIIALLKKHQSVNTPEFRQHGIMQPASRILELKLQGYPIEKVLENFIDGTGKKHSGVARYYFTSNPPATDNACSEVAA